VSSIYTANGDGTDVVRLTNPADGTQYNWSEWAMGTSHIVYSARKGPAGAPENIFSMRSDGTDRVQLTFGSWQSGQPRVSPDGRSLLFTSFRPGWQLTAIYKLDLETLQITNLSAAPPTPNHFDADPKWSPDGKRIIFAHGSIPGSSSGRTDNEIWSMAADGTDRKRLTDSSYFDVDPMYSPDGSRVVYSSYRGPGGPHDPRESNQLQVKLKDWQLTLLNPTTGKQTELTEGLACYLRPQSNPCSPRASSGFAGTWSPNGDVVAFIGVLSSKEVCICSIDTSGGQGHVILRFTDLVVNWLDWARAANGPATAVAAFGSKAPTSNMMITAAGGQTAPSALYTSGPDLWKIDPVSLPGGLVAREARFTPDRRHIVFAAFGTGVKAATLPKPPGKVVATHYTLPQLAPTLYDALGAPPASTQLFMVDARGRHLVRLTTPTTEDPRDALPSGEQRANVEPDVSPDGTTVVFASVASTGESAILRLSLKTGRVLSLTNATAGAVPVADREPRWSPDGLNVAFTTTVGADMQIAVVNRDGTGYRQLTNDTYFNTAPAWSPDGKSLVYASYRGPAKDAKGNAIDPLRANGWSLVRVDVATRAQTTLWTAPSGPILGPVWSPDGSAVAFVGQVISGLPTSVYRLDLQTGRTTAVQPDDNKTDLSVDWR
jgi:Tol biopolymer transport system component